MMAFMQAGGLGIWIVLLFAVLTGAAAVAFALKPDPRRVELLRALSRATVFAVLTSVSANLAAVGWKVPQNEEWARSPDLPLIVMTGIAESLTPAILGFAFLGIAWFITAVGVRRSGT
jgi:hypothetical protein